MVIKTHFHGPTAQLWCSHHEAGTLRKWIHKTLAKSLHVAQQQMVNDQPEAHVVEDDLEIARRDIYIQA